MQDNVGFGSIFIQALSIRNIFLVTSTLFFEERELLQE